jgi:hypothetical protein
MPKSPAETTTFHLIVPVSRQSKRLPNLYGHDRPIEGAKNTAYAKLPSFSD